LPEKNGSNKIHNNFVSDEKPTLWHTGNQKGHCHWRRHGWTWVDMSHPHFSLRLFLRLMQIRGSVRRGKVTFGAHTGNQKERKGKFGSLQNTEGEGNLLLSVDIQKLEGLLLCLLYAYCYRTVSL